MGGNGLTISPPELLGLGQDAYQNAISQGMLNQRASEGANTQLPSIYPQSPPLAQSMSPLSDMKGPQFVDYGNLTVNRAQLFKSELQIIAENAFDAKSKAQ